MVVIPLSSMHVGLFMRRPATPHEDGTTGPVDPADRLLAVPQSGRT